MQRGAEEYAGKGATQDNAPGAAGEAGKRAFDAWTWRHTGSGTISVGNILVGLRGIVAEYSGASLSVGTSGTYVYAHITWTLDDDGNVTAIASVELETTTSFSDAAKELTDGDGKQTGLHVPLGLFKSASGTWGTTVVCVRRYFAGAIMLDPDTDAAGWTCDTFRTAEDFDQESVETVQADGTDTTGKKFKRYLQLRNFEIGDDGAVLNAADAGWTDPTTGKTSEKLLVRKVTAEGFQAALQSAQPRSGGDATNVAMKWDATKGGWVKALVHATNDDSITAKLTDGARVVVGAVTAPDGSLIQLKTAPHGADRGDGGRRPPGPRKPGRRDPRADRRRTHGGPTARRDQRADRGDRADGADRGDRVADGRDGGGGCLLGRAVSEEEDAAGLCEGGIFADDDDDLYGGGFHGMSMKIMLNCNGNVALHPDYHVPVLMESPCPFTPWTWAGEDPDWVTLDSTNPGQTLTVSAREDVGSFSGHFYFTSKIIWDCAKGGMTVSAAFTSDYPKYMFADIRAGTGTMFRLSEAKTMGPVALDGFYLRFGLWVRLNMSDGDSATLNFAWTT